MYTILTVVIIVICILIILVILIQNPKGGGLGGSFGGVSSNTMGGARKAADFLERATWGLAIALLVVSLLTVTAIPNSSRTDNVGKNTELEEQITDFDIDNFDPTGGQ